MVADVLIPGVTHRAVTTPGHERNCDAIAPLPLHDTRANCLHDSCKLVTRYMRESDVGIVSNPAVPVTSAQTCGHDFDHHAMCFGGWIWDLAQRGCAGERFIQDGFHVKVQ